MREGTKYVCENQQHELVYFHVGEKRQFGGVRLGILKRKND